MGNQRLKRWAGLGLAAGLSVVPMVAATAAGADTSLCGATITVSTTLTHDVGPCPSDGLIIGASNITLDLGGHRVFGTPETGDGAGIRVPGLSGVTVRNGTVSHFDGGVVLVGSANSTVTGINARDNIGELGSETHPDTEFGAGIVLADASRNRIIGNVADHNGPSAGIHVYGNSDNNLIQGNTVSNNNLPTVRPGHGDPTFGFQDDVGIRLDAFGVNLAPNFNTIYGNNVLYNGFDGIALSTNANDNRIEANVVTRNGALGDIRRGDGIHLGSRVFRTVITGNRVTYNARHGIRIDPTIALNVPALNNQIVRNVAVYNGADSPEDPAFDLSDGNRFCDNNVWSQNQHFTEDNPGSDCLN